MADDVLLNKAAAIERAVGRVREEYAGDDRNLLANQTRQDDYQKRLPGVRQPIGAPAKVTTAEACPSPGARSGVIMTVCGFLRCSRSF